MVTDGVPKICIAIEHLHASSPVNPRSPAVPPPRCPKIRHTDQLWRDPAARRSPDEAEVSAGV